MTTFSNLDGQELFHLALEASQRGEHGQAITYLKQALDLPAGSTATSSDYAKFMYVLGAEYAQIGMVDRAQDFMSQALSMNPDLHTARFQLGLLHITCNQPAQALSTLAPLEKLPEQAALHHFGMGLTHLLQDQLPACLASLQRGIELNSASAEPNAALNTDMQNLLQALVSQANAGQVSVTVGQGNVETGFLMSAYHRSNEVN